MKKKAKRKPKYKIIKMTLPNDVATFYKEVSKFAGVSFSKVILVVMGMKIVGERLAK